MRKSRLLFYTLITTLAVSIVGVVYNIFSNRFLVSNAGNASRQVENLNRGLIAIKNSSGIMLSWRLLGTEEYTTTFNVYRDGQRIAKGISDSTDYTDVTGLVNNTYYITSSNSKGEEITKSNKITPMKDNYLDIAIDKPADGAKVLAKIISEDVSFTKSNL